MAAQGAPQKDKIYPVTLSKAFLSQDSQDLKYHTFKCTRTLFILRPGSTLAHLLFSDQFKPANSLTQEGKLFVRNRGDASSVHLEMPNPVSNQMQITFISLPLSVLTF